jgi:Xaa-Pro aminopeptidase
MTALGSEWTQCSNIVCSGPYGAPYRRFTSDRIIKEGDMVIIDIGGCFNGYWADFTRTYLCGKNIDPAPKQRELHQEAYDALWACIEASQPGNTNLDVVAACPEKNNLGGVLGHGSGLACWELPGINSSYGEAVTLVPGMYFSLEPYAGDPKLGYGVRLENNVIVRPTGPEVINSFPFDRRLLDRVHPMDPTSGRKPSSVGSDMAHTNGRPAPARVG